MTLTDFKSRVLLEQVRQGNEQAATELFDRFVDRMIDLARSRISPRLARRLDPEDVVQSAYRSFFRNARAGRYDLRESGDLWRLLAAITLNKVRMQTRRHTAQKRAIGAEEKATGSELRWGVPVEAVAREPMPVEAAALLEETQRMMNRLPPLYRKVLQLRLQGLSVEETAKQAECAERTVQRAVEGARTRLEQQLAQYTE